MNIIDKLKEKGYETVPADFYGKIDEWSSWYDGNVKGFHDFRVWNGQKHIQCRRYTMGMAKKVAEDWANLLMNEKVKITLEGENEQAFFDSVCAANNFAVKVNEMQEMKSGKGTAAYVLRAIGNVNESGEVVDGGEIKIDYVSAKNIFPITWENGIVEECAFATTRKVKDATYCYLQIHRKGDDGKYIIENSLYKENSGNLSEVNMADVEGFQNVSPSVETGSADPLFVLDRLNIANNYDQTLPMGIPAFANAIDQLKGVDIAYDSYVNEFVLGKKRIMVKPSAAENRDGEPVFDNSELVYYVLPEDISDDGLITPIDMKLRTSEHNAGVQDMLNALSSKCGFGENHYKYENGNVSTATQIISENSTMFRTIKKHEIILEDVLIKLCRIILRLGNSVLRMGLDENVEISIDFDDSIIEDKNTEFSRDMQLLSAGILNDWEFRAKWLNEDEETAKSALPKMQDLVTERQEETE